MGKASNTRIGVGYSKGITDNLNRNNVAGQPGTTTFDDSQQVALQQDVFIENQTQWTEHISGIVGVQYTQAERKYSGFNSTAPASIGGPNLFFERRYDDVTPRLGLIINRNTNAQWYGNFSGAFEPPSFGELGAGGAAGALNINNQAQKANSVEVGYRSTKPLIANGLHWDVAAYIMNIRDELMATIDPVTSLASTLNVDKTQRSGFELGLSYIQGPWTVRSSTLLNRFKFENDRDFGNNTIAGAPSFASRLQLERRININLNLGVSLEGATRTWVDHLNTVQAPGYGIVNVHAHGQLLKGVNWFVDARNLGDKAYVATTGVVRQFNPAAPQQFLPGDGRSVYAGLRWNFE